MRLDAMWQRFVTRAPPHCFIHHCGKLATYEVSLRPIGRMLVCRRHLYQAFAEDKVKSAAHLYVFHQSQFSLWHLFVAITVLGLVLGLIVQHLHG